MTGYTVHTGSTERFSTGWDQIFKKNPNKKGIAKTGAKKPTTKKRAEAKKRSKA